MKQAEDHKTRDLLSKTFRGPYLKPYKDFEHRRFGAFVAFCRKKRQMTQSQYAGSINVSLRSLITLERMVTRPVYASGVVRKWAYAEFKQWVLMAEAADQWMARKS